jgi:hypothetical protein
MSKVMDDLESANGQRLVKVKSLDAAARRHEIVDPAKDPPSAYWPGSGVPRSRRLCNQPCLRRASILPRSPTGAVLAFPELAQLSLFRTGRP